MAERLWARWPLLLVLGPLTVALAWLGDLVPSSGPAVAAAFQGAFHWLLVAPLFLVPVLGVLALMGGAPEGKAPRRAFLRRAGLGVLLSLWSSAFALAAIRTSGARGLAPAFLGRYQVDPATTVLVPLGALGMLLLGTALSNRRWLALVLGAGCYAGIAAVFALGWASRLPGMPEVSPACGWCLPWLPAPAALVAGWWAAGRGSPQSRAANALAAFLPAAACCFVVLWLASGLAASGRLGLAQGYYAGRTADGMHAVLEFSGAPLPGAWPAGAEGDSVFLASGMALLDLPARKVTIFPHARSQSWVSLSPSGRRLCWVERDGLRLASEAEGWAVRKVRRNFTRDLYPPPPVWAPGEGMIALWAPTRYGRGDAQAIVVLDPRGRTLWQDAGGGRPVWLSRDRLCYRQYPSRLACWEPGGGRRRVPWPAGGRRMQATPDGRFLLVSRQQRDSRGVTVLAADTLRPVRELVLPGWRLAEALLPPHWLIQIPPDRSGMAITRLDLATGKAKPIPLPKGRVGEPVVANGRLLVPSYRLLEVRWLEVYPRRRDAEDPHRQGFGAVDSVRGGDGTWRDALGKVRPFHPLRPETWPPRWPRDSES